MWSHNDYQKVISLLFERAFDNCSLIQYRNIKSEGLKSTVKNKIVIFLANKQNQLVFSYKNYINIGLSEAN